MTLKALFLNCTLKKSPQESNTHAMIQKAERIFHTLNIETEEVRVADFSVKLGNTSDEGKGDEWPAIYRKIKEANILVIATPIWRGDRSSVAKIVAERMDGVMSDADEKTGQYPTYNKVGGVLVDGNEDGAKTCISRICYDLVSQGYCVPPNSHSYWVGEAGPGKSYIAAGGEQHLFTNKNLYYMVHNLSYFARLLQENPIPTNLNQLSEEAKKESKPEEQ